MEPQSIICITCILLAVWTVRRMPMLTLKYTVAAIAVIVEELGKHPLQRDIDALLRDGYVRDPKKEGLFRKGNILFRIKHTEDYPCAWYVGVEGCSVQAKVNSGGPSISITYCLEYLRDLLKDNLAEHMQAMKTLQNATAWTLDVLLGDQWNEVIRTIRARLVSERAFDFPGSREQMEELARLMPDVAFQGVDDMDGEDFFFVVGRGRYEIEQHERTR